MPKAGDPAVTSAAVLVGSETTLNILSVTAPGPVIAKSGLTFTSSFESFVGLLGVPTQIDMQTWGPTNPTCVTLRAPSTSVWRSSPFPLQVVPPIVDPLHGLNPGQFAQSFASPELLKRLLAVDVELKKSFD
ncbi:MAG: hypothetical protein LLH30_16425 [Candidatus Manganitrophus sp. SA1]|nr:hypothetical protein [Candidatus Manganitrophus morganii]